MPHIHARSIKLKETTSAWAPARPTPPTHFAMPPVVSHGDKGIDLNCAIYVDENVRGECSGEGCIFGKIQF